MTLEKVQQRREEEMRQPSQNRPAPKRAAKKNPKYSEDGEPCSSKKKVMVSEIGFSLEVIYLN